MGLIHIEMSATLDHVGQAARGPEPARARRGRGQPGPGADLLREKLVDRLDLWIHPIVLGVGKKLFAGGDAPTSLTLLEPPVAGAKGTVFLRYGLAEGTPGTGDMSRPGRGLRGDA